MTFQNQNENWCEQIFNMYDLPWLPEDWMNIYIAAEYREKYNIPKRELLLLKIYDPGSPRNVLSANYSESRTDWMQKLWKSVKLQVLRINVRKNN